MSVHVTNIEIQQWIQDTRHPIDSVDTALESSAFSHVAGALAIRYDTTTWIDVNTTPELVRSVISMLIAAWTINKSHAEAVGEVDSYGVHLESSALTLLGGLADGSITLSDTVGVSDYATGRPAFWPTDIATQTAIDEGSDAEGAAPLAFSMGKVF
jgi:hypothetical protein